MIVGYIRPRTIPEAIDVLQKGGKLIKPLAGGSGLAHEKDDISVVDLQDLGLNKINYTDGEYVVGSMVTLEDLLVFYKGRNPFELAIQIQGSKNQREQGTIGGLVCTENGRSALLTLLLSLDPMMTWEPYSQELLLSEWLSKMEVSNELLLITGFRFKKDISVKFESIGRTPFDRPIVCIALSSWESGRLRVVAGGFGKIPLVVYDGDRIENIDKNILTKLDETEDQWATSDYRKNAARKIIQRMLLEDDIIKDGKR